MVLIMVAYAVTAGDQATRKPTRAITPTLSEQLPLRVCVCPLCIKTVCECIDGLTRRRNSRPVSEKTRITADGSSLCVCACVLFAY